MREGRVCREMIAEAGVLHLGRNLLDLCPVGPRRCSDAGSHCPRNDVSPPKH